MKHEQRFYRILGIVSLLLAIAIFCVPIYFMFVNSLKNAQEASSLNIAWPSQIHPAENYLKVIQEQNYMIVRAFGNSILITFGAILLLILACSMGGYVLQRRSEKAMTMINFLILAGLMVPPAILPTIWVMMGLKIYKTIWGMILVEVALNIPFTTMLYRGYISSIPKEVEEAAFVDGCGKIRMFFQIVFPLLKPVTSTVIVLSAVNVFNDFVNPLYFLPGANNVTVQLTLYNFMGRFQSSWNLLFADVILITIPPLILFIFFNKKIIAGMTAGSVKG